MDWFGGTKIYFLTSEVQSSPYDLWIQTGLTVLAAWLGAFATHRYQQHADTKEQKRQQERLAVSISSKLAKAVAVMRGLKNSFYAGIDNDTPEADYWRIVQPGVSFEHGLTRLTDGEFELLLYSDPDAGLPGKVENLIDFACVNVSAILEYSERMLCSPKTGSF